MSGLELFTQPAWRHLVFALLHTLWQGAAIAILAALVLRRLPARRQEARYLLALAAQFGVLLAGLTTWAVLEREPARPTAAVAPRVETAPASPSAAGIDAPASLAARDAGPSGGADWVPLAAAVWLGGVGVMVVRTAASALAALRLAHGPLVLDRAILDAVDRLKGEMRIERAIRVVSPAGLAGPAVLGLLRPTLILPVALLTGMPPDELRAILAHELAHIRRYDYLLNLAQMLVEALLFFNPAAWWLGRQARLEREACCDALAARLAGGPLPYSRALAAWADRLRTAAPAPAVAPAWEGRGPSTLLERVVRVLRPGDRPRPRISWTGLVVLLVAGPVVLAGLRRGTTAAVALAAQVLAPAERVEGLKRAQAEYAPEVRPGKATLKGTVRAPGGKPLTKPVWGSTLTRVANNTTNATVGPIAGPFALEVPTGTTWLSIDPDDHAPATVGPFELKPGATVEGIDIVLDPGFPARIRVVDGHGAPVAGARLTGGPVVEDSGTGHGDGWVTDGDGVATIAHAARRLYWLQVKARGFQVASPRFTPEPGATTTLAIVPARPVRGVVVAPDGTPIAGARLRPYAKRREHGLYSYGTHEPVAATTDEAGRFTLDALDDDASYAFLIETDRHGRALANDVRPGQEALRWTVGPDLTIAGTIKGDLTKLEIQGGKPSLRMSQLGRTGALPDDMRPPPLTTFVPVEPAEGGGRFAVSGVLPGEVVLDAGGHIVRLDVERPESTVAIDLTAPAPQAGRRRVIVRIVAPDGAPAPTGAFYVSASATNPDVQAASNFGREVPIENGEAAFEAPAPGSLYVESRSVIGYWFKEQSSTVEPGDGPLRIEVRGVPAGAIVGQVVGPDGEPAAAGISLRATAVEKPPGLEGESIAVNNVRVDAQGRFFLSPLPLGGTYVAIASRGHNVQVGAPVRLDGTKAAERITIRMARPAAAEGRVVDPEGRPLAGVPVSLKLEHPHAGTSWGPPTPTGGDGRFRFDDLNPALTGYGISVDIRRGYQPAEAKLEPGGPPVEVRLGRGHVVAGRVVDAATGRPIPGVTIYAHPRDWRPGQRYAYEAEAKTDAEGRFRLSNLPEATFTFGDRDGIRWEAPDERRTGFADQSEPIELRGTLPAWSKLKPAPAGGK